MLQKSNITTFSRSGYDKEANIQLLVPHATEYTLSSCSSNVLIRESSFFFSEKYVNDYFHKIPAK
jgi:hypothetical protein